MMTFLTGVLLHAIHLVYSIALLVNWGWQHLTRTSPQPLTAIRRRIPKHLALVFVTDLSPYWEENLICSVTNAVGWCRAVGIRKLTVYDEHGRLLERVELIRKLFLGTPKATSAGTLEKLNAESKCITDTSMTLCLASRRSSKQVIASVASSFASQRKSKKSAIHSRCNNEVKFKLPIDVLHASLEVEDGLSSPDFLILHSTCPSSRYAPLELHGFPPWHIRLSEMYFNTPMQRSPIDEISFRRALDEFAGAEMRFGK